MDGFYQDTHKGFESGKGLACSINFQRTLWIEDGEHKKNGSVLSWECRYQTNQKKTLTNHG